MPIEAKERAGAETTDAQETRDTLEVRREVGARQPLAAGRGDDDMVGLPNELSGHHALRHSRAR
jgi:hypothetical protein